MPFGFCLDDVVAASLWAGVFVVFLKGLAKKETIGLLSFKKCNCFSMLVRSKLPKFLLLPKQSETGLLSEQIFLCNFAHTHDEGCISSTNFWLQFRASLCLKSSVVGGGVGFDLPPHRGALQSDAQVWRPMDLTRVGTSMRCSVDILLEKIPRLAPRAGDRSTHSKAPKN